MNLYKLLILLFLFVFLSTETFAMQPIVRAFSSVRAQGMGNVRYTTGLYEENFYANPARATANPERMIQLPKISFETNAAAVKALKDLLKSSSGLQQFSHSVGKPITGRFQMIFPAYYEPTFITRDWALGTGLVMGVETHSQLSQTGTIDPSSLFTAGPVLTVARRLMEEDRLSVGLSMHTEYRMSVSENVSVIDFLGGKSIRGNDLGGNGLGLDFDLGTRFLPHWTWLGATYEVGFAINNLLGGYYKNLGRPNKIWKDNPTPTYRSYNLGISASKQSVWILDELTTAFEMTDIGNNLNGSLFRLLHLGTEAKWTVLAVRFGVNQGYLTAGLGWDVGFFDLNFATYGEEMSLNAGGLEDRRYAIEFGFQI